MPARHALGAPAAGGAAARADRLGGARPGPARAFDLAGRGRPRDGRLLARHGPAAVRRARGVPRAARAAARRAVRRGGPARRRRHPRARAAEREAGAAVLVSTHLVALAAAACETPSCCAAAWSAGTAPAAALTGPEGEQRYRADAGVTRARREPATAAGARPGRAAAPGGLWARSAPSPPSGSPPCAGPARRRAILGDALLPVVAVAAVTPPRSRPGTGSPEFLVLPARAVSLALLPGELGRRRGDRRRRPSAAARASRPSRSPSRRRPTTSGASSRRR